MQNSGLSNGTGGIQVRVAPRGAPRNRAREPRWTETTRDRCRERPRQRFGRSKPARKRDVRNERLRVKRRAEAPQAVPHVLGKCTKSGIDYTGTPQHPCLRKRANVIDGPCGRSIEFDGQRIGECVGSGFAQFTDERQSQVQVGSGHAARSHVMATQFSTDGSELLSRCRVRPERHEAAQVRSAPRKQRAAHVGDQRGPAIDQTGVQLDQACTCRQALERCLCTVDSADPDDG